MQLSFLYSALFLASSQCASAIPQQDGSDPGGTAIYAPTPTATVTFTLPPDSVSSTSAAPEPEFSIVKFGDIWAWVGYDCYGKRDVEEPSFPGDSVYPPGKTDRGRYLLRALADAREIADKAGQWPSVGTDASDLYIGKGFDGSIFQQNVSLDLAKVPDVQAQSRVFLATHIRMRCDDYFQECNKKIGNDPRVIAAYANSTKASTWGWYYDIDFCDPFFKENTLTTINAQNKDRPKEELQMQFMQSSGQRMLHELLHLLIISENRPKIKDQLFDGSTGRRIYGPIDVAKAARIANQNGQDDLERQATNADTLAVFAQAFYWRNIFGVTPPPMVANVAAPDGAVFQDLISDNGDNYVEYVVPGLTDDSTDPQSPAPTGPTFPSPSCLPAAEGGFDPSMAVAAIGDFCLQQNGTISSNNSQPISKSYDGGHNTKIRLTLSWDTLGTNCPASQSPSQNAGRDCNTIFHNIVFGCPENNPSNQNGGSLSWQCGYYYLGFDQGTPDVAPTSTQPPVTNLDQFFSTAGSTYPTPT